MAYTTRYLHYILKGSVLQTMHYEGYQDKKAGGVPPFQRGEQLGLAKRARGTNPWHHSCDMCKLLNSEPQLSHL